MTAMCKTCKGEIYQLGRPCDYIDCKGEAGHPEWNHTHLAAYVTCPDWDDPQPATCRNYQHPNGVYCQADHGETDAAMALAQSTAAALDLLERAAQGTRNYPQDYCLAQYGANGACIRLPGHEGKCQDATGHRFDGAQAPAPCIDGVNGCWYGGSDQHQHIDYDGSPLSVTA